MVDDDDFNFFLLLWNPTGWFTAILGIVMLVALYFAVQSNHEECAAQHCAHGKPILAHHECLCVETPIDLSDGGTANSDDAEEVR